MRLFYLVFVFSFISLAGVSADSPRDSLKKVLAQLPPVNQSFGKDTTRIKILFELGKRSTQDDTAIAFFHQALLISEKQKWTKGRMIANCYYGYYSGRKGYYYRACEHLLRGLHLAEEAENKTYEGFALRYLADNYLNMNSNGRAMGYYKAAMPMLLESGDTLRYLIAINNMALIYFHNGAYNKAISLFNLCLKKNRSPYFKDVEGYCLVNLSACYRQKKEYDRALSYLELFRELKQDNPNEIAVADAQKARILLMKGHTKNALELARKAHLEGKNLMSSTIADLNEVLYLAYKKNGNYQAALVHHEELTSVQAKDKNDMQQKQINALRFEYENEKNKIEVERVNRDLDQSKSERFMLVGGLIIFLLFIGLLIFNNYILNKKNRQILQVQYQLAVSNEELNNLNNTLEERVQLRTAELVRKNREIQEAYYNGQSIERKRVASELHDNLGSTLATIKWQLNGFEIENLSSREQQVYTKLVTSMDQAYTDVRHISHNLMPPELEKLGLSVALENLIDDLNRDGRIILSFDSEYRRGLLGKKQEMEVYSISRELITNILKHAKASIGQVKIAVSDDFIRLTVSDNGIGIRSDLLSNGMGLKNIMERATAIPGEIRISPADPIGTIVVLTIWKKQWV
jgi:signal transduction histidine kinase